MGKPGARPRVFQKADHHAGIVRRATNKPPVKHKQKLQRAKTSSKRVVYISGIRSYSPVANRLPEAPSEDFQQQWGRPFHAVADISLSNERQRLIALIERLPTAELTRVTSYVRAAVNGERSRSARAQDSRQIVHDQWAAAAAPRECLLGSGSQGRCKNGKQKLPALPRGLSWPKKTYSQERKKSGVTIEQFLEREWRQLIDRGFGELRWLRIVDPSAVNAIAYFERPDPKTGKRRRLPPELRFLTEKEVTDLKVAGGLAAAIKSDPRIALTVATRVRRGLAVPAV